MSISSLLSAFLLLALFSAPAVVSAQTVPAEDSAATFSPLQGTSQLAAPDQSFFTWNLEPPSNNFLEDVQPSQFKPPLKFQIPLSRKAKDAAASQAGLCYSMRSYVVARDAKDSDAVHPVSYSTCQPASRYEVRTTELRVTPAER